MVVATKTRGVPISPDVKKKLRREILFFVGVAALAFLGFVLAFWAVQLTKQAFYAGELPKTESSGKTPAFPPQPAEENLLPSSFTDLFSSAVYIASTSREIGHDKGAAGSYFLFQESYSRSGPALFVESINLNTYNAAVVKAKISEVDLKIDNGEIRWFLSNDGAAWNRVSVGEFLRFDNPSGRLLLWRAEILPSLGSELSFSLDRIRIDYGVKQ